MSKQCHHISGNGGGKAAVRSVISKLKNNTFVFRTDVKEYYASINHEILTGMLEKYIKDKRVLDLLLDYMQRVVVDRGLYREVYKGISLGCPLSPLMGALYLKPVDDLMAKSELSYARFMDDWAILSPTRWKLRAIITQVNQILQKLKVKQHPNKTFIGRIAKGFDFLGYYFTNEEFTLASKTIGKFLNRADQLYEQKSRGTGYDTSRQGQYVQRWLQWTRTGLDQYPRLVLNPLSISVNGAIPITIPRHRALLVRLRTCLASAVNHGETTESHSEYCVGRRFGHGITGARCE